MNSNIVAGVAGGGLISFKPLERLSHPVDQPTATVHRRPTECQIPDRGEWRTVLLFILTTTRGPIYLLPLTETNAPSPTSW